MIGSMLANLGCAHTDHLLIDSDACRRQGVPVRILSDFPTSPYVRVAVVEASQWNWFVPARWESLRLGLCREAHELGADAIVHTAIKNPSYSWSVGGFGGGGSTRKLMAIAIRYTDPGTDALSDEHE